MMKIWNRERCIEHYQKVSVPSSFCPTVWDSVTCWPPTMPGTVAKQRCPALKGIDDSKYAYRTCLENGKWYSRNDINTEGYSNYSDCYSAKSKQVIGTFQDKSFDVNQMKSTLDAIGFSTISLSLVALLVSVVLIACFVSQRTNRRLVLIPLFVSAMMESVAYLVYRSVLQIDGLKGDTVVCQIMSFFTRFFGIAFYAWVMVLALNYVFRAFRCVIKNDHILIMYLIGFGLPVSFTPIWLATTKYVMSDSNLCYFENIHFTKWITDAPKLVCLLSAMVMFAVALIAVFRKQHISGHNVHFDCRKSFKQWCLGGVLLAMYIAPVEAYVAITAESNWNQLGETALYLQVALYNCRGFVLAVVICFLDAEVCFSCRRPAAIA